MLPFMIKGIIIYLIVIASVRLMGKRQIGELQPAELVITLLMSEIASMSLHDGDSPLLLSIIGIFLLASLEVLFSSLAMKSGTIRTLFQGHSVLIIENGKLKTENMRLIRYSIDDLLEALRLKDVFDISEVEYAYVETNGSVSVMKKSENETVTAADLGLKKPKTVLPCLVISDGKIIEREFRICDMTGEKLKEILEENGLSQKQVLLMTCDSNGKTNIVRKDSK